MDKISKLLKETQNLLEGFSSGTLSPVSSYENSEDESEFTRNSSKESEFRKVLRKFSGAEILKFIENGSIPKMALHICVEEKCKDLEVYKAILRTGCDPLEQNFDHKTALTLLLDQAKEKEIVAEEDKCLISTLLGEWELRKAATNESKLFKLIHSRNWKDLYAFLVEEGSGRIICKVDPKYAGISPLHEIAARNDVAILKKLLTKFKGSIDLNVKAIGSGNTPLHEASHMSATEMVGFLLESGARSDFKNAAGKIPAHLGTEKIQVLIEFNHINMKSTSKELSSKKTADLFVQTTKSASSESLSREERKLKQIIGFLDQIEKHKDDSVSHDSEIEDGKRTKLFDLETILQRESHTGRTILHRYARRNQSEKLIKFLKSQEFTSTQCKDMKLFEVVDNGGHTPLYDAAAEGSLESVKIFLFGGRTPKIKNLLIDPSIPAKLTGDTPLHGAAAAGNVEIVELLLKVGAKKDATNIDGKKPYDVTISKSIKRLLSDLTETDLIKINTIVSNSKSVSTANINNSCDTNSTNATIKTHPDAPVKRGPGRPRKYPRPNDVPQKATKEIIRSSSKQQLQQPPLPLNEIFSDKSNCIILIKFEDEWLMLKDHFSSIYKHLVLTTSRTHHKIRDDWFRPVNQMERIEISKLPRLGNLVEILQLHNAENLSFIPKSVAIQILETDFNFTLTGPFGYIDIAKIRKSQSNLFYSGCPLKLKMKLGKEKDIVDQKQNNNSALHWLASASFEFETPKSPKSLHI